MKKTTTALSISALFAMMFGMSVATAQPPAGQPPAGQPQAGGEAPTIDADTRENFLGAYAEIMQIQNHYAERLQTAGNEEEAMELQQAAQEEMQDAVQSNDMTVEEYNTVIQTASANPELMAELEAAIESAME